MLWYVGMLYAFIFFAFVIREVWIHQTSLTPGTFYWSACSKTEKWAVMILCVMSIDFSPFNNFDILFWNCSDSVVSSKIVEVKQIGVSTLKFPRTFFSISDTEKRESPETNSHLLPSKPDRSFLYNIRDDPASACPEKRCEYADSKLRELSFKTWPLNKPTIVQDLSIQVWSTSMWKLNNVYQ